MTVARQAGVRRDARLSLLSALLVALPRAVAAQQVVDTAFRPRVAAPAYAAGSGPLVLVDEAHRNGHAITGSYRPFAELLRADGYRVEALNTTFTPAALRRGAILVVVNALAAANVDNWTVPTYPAFAPDEVEALRQWIADGGALLLVADHMPFPGAAEALGQRLGFAFTNGFAIDTSTWDPIVFRRSDGSLAPHPITDGRGGTERIDSVATFWGQGFTAIDRRAHALFTFGPAVISYYPLRAWQFNDSTPTRVIHGWLQAAAVTVAKGRVVVLGEAGLLSAQVAGPQRNPMGMNAPIARQNQQFVLNLLHWLSGLLPVAE